MKILLSTLLVSFWVLTSQGFASTVREASLTSFNVSSNWKDLKGLSSGTVKVDENRREVQIVLKHTKESLDDVLVTLPIVEVRAGKCNSKIIKAYRDRGTTDGPKETIVIQDNSSFSCPQEGAVPTTQVSYVEEGGWSAKLYRASFDGSLLK